MEYLPDMFDAMLSMGWLFLGIVALSHALKWLWGSEARHIERKRQERKQFEQMAKNMMDEAKRRGVTLSLEVKQND